jgi:hypothetical protein
MKKFLLSSVLVFFILPLFAQNNPPTAVTDIVMAPRGYVEFNPLLNDYDIDGDSIRVFNILIQPKHGRAKKINDSTIRYKAFPSFTGGNDTLAYRLRDNGVPVMDDTGWVYVIAGNSLTFDSVDVNDIDAAVNANGFLFGEWRGLNYRQVFTSPKNSEKNTLFCGDLWVTAKDSIDSMHVAAPRYLTFGNDYWAGPISDTYDESYDYTWDRLWKISKLEIDNHIDSFGITGYVPPQSIIEWPANGNVSLGQLASIAPYVDVDSDGYYNPYVGDYPQIKGDEAVFFVFNDDRDAHTESGGNALKIEVHGMLYAYECDKASWAYYNSVFLHYDIINCSQNIYHDTYLGSYLDFELGYFNDDFVGCDVSRSLYYGYNGDDLDGTGSSMDYYANPPAQGVYLIKGPLMDADGIDNPSGLCDYGVNGSGFGDSFIDNERMGLTNFIMSWDDCNINGWGDYNVDVSIYYDLMRSIDTTGPLQYGGMGSFICDAYGPECRFSYPGTSDPCLWGTGGILPNGAIDWTEVNENDPPGDRISVGSSGPFTFKPGDTQSMDYAFIFARDYDNPSSTAAIPILQNYADTIKKYFGLNTNPCLIGPSSTVDVPVTSIKVNIYPNPADDFVTIETSGMTGTLKIEVFNIIGEKIYQGKIKSSAKETIQISQFKSGLYFINISDGVFNINKKVVKL